MAVSKFKKVFFNCLALLVVLAQKSAKHRKLNAE